jgi:hypothetical protein
LAVRSGELAAEGGAGEKNERWHRDVSGRWDTEKWKMPDANIVESVFSRLGFAEIDFKYDFR